MKRFLLLPALFLAAACASPEEIALQQQAQRADDERTCLSYGLRQGSEAFGNCLLQLDLARQQRYYQNAGPHYYGGYGSRIGTGISYGY